MPDLKITQKVTSQMPDFDRLLGCGCMRSTISFEKPKRKRKRDPLPNQDILFKDPEAKSKK